MSDSKLTKKQKKGLAFRQRTTGKRRPRNELMEMETAATPTLEDQNIASIQSDTLQDQKKRWESDETVRVSDQDKQGSVAKKGKRTAEENNVLVSVEVVKTIKRKRASSEEGVQEDQTSESHSRKVLKRKKNNDVYQSSETKGKTPVKQRFILFVGSRFHVLFNDLRLLSSSFLREFEVYNSSRSNRGSFCNMRFVLFIHYYNFIDSFSL